MYYSKRDHTYIAYDENGSIIAYYWPYSRLLEILRSKGYSPVPANSHCGRTIHDKVKGQLV